MTVTEELRSQLGLPPQQVPGRLPLRHKIAVAFGSALLTILVGIVTLFAIAEYRAATSRVDKTHHVELATERTLSELRNVVLSARGYALTGLPQFTMPFSAGTSGVRGQLDTLRALTADNPAQAERVRELDSIVQVRIANARDLVTLRERNDLRSSEIAATEREGLATMDDVRTVVAAIRENEETLLGQRIARRERARLFAMLTVGFGSALAFGLATIIVRSIRADVRILERSRDALADQASQLLEQSELMQNQAIELEAQQAELEAQNEALEQSNDNLIEASRSSERARAEAVAANAAKGQFLANMSHELRTPLNAIGGYTDLLQLGVYGDLTSEQRQTLARIKRSTLHLLSLINDVLNFAKLEAGKVMLSSMRTSVPEIVESVYPLVAPELEEKRLRYSAAMDPRNDGRTPEAFADPEKLSQILLNLLSNAVKFTEPGGEVSVSWLVHDGAVDISVRDSGIGVPADRMADIFEPFVQVRRTDGTSPQGTGLGLAISRDLARMMGGELRGESAPGHGSVFTLTLPRTPPKT